MTADHFQTNISYAHIYKTFDSPHNCLYKNIDIISRQTRFRTTAKTPDPEPLHKDTANIYLLWNWFCHEMMFKFLQSGLKQYRQSNVFGFDLGLFEKKPVTEILPFLKTLRIFAILTFVVSGKMCSSHKHLPVILQSDLKHFDSGASLPIFS